MIETYAIRFDAVEGFDFSMSGQGGNSAADSDADPLTGLTGAITVTAGQSNPDLDAGLVLVGSSFATMGSRVWLDSDQDGIQDVGEVGLADVTVTLLNSLGAVVATEVTDASGIYAFTELGAGAYQVEFQVLDNHVFTSANAGLDDGLDSDADIVTGRSAQIVLAAGDHDDTLDAGMVYQPPSTASIGGYVWDDQNGNGLQDDGAAGDDLVISDENGPLDEAGLPSVTVHLLNSGGQVIGTETTDGNGAYLFAGLAAGTYGIQFGLPADYIFTSVDTGMDDGVDSDADPNTGLTAQIALTTGQVNDSLDAGMVYVPPEGIGFALSVGFDDAGSDGNVIVVDSDNLWVATPDRDIFFIRPNAMSGPGDIVDLGRISGFTDGEDSLDFSAVGSLTDIVGDLGLIDPMALAPALAPHAIGWSVDGPGLVTVWANLGDGVVNPGTSGDIIKIQLTDPTGGFGARDIVL